MKRTIVSRRRCTICRNWYYPHPSSCETQKVCSKACRKKRKNKLAKKRRENELQEYRVSERYRQRKSRLKRSKAGPDPVLSKPKLSQARLSLEDSELFEKFVFSWDKFMQMSRARLCRELTVILTEKASLVGQVGQKRGHVTGRADSLSP